jgi:hypothetical protein
MVGTPLFALSGLSIFAGANVSSHFLFNFGTVGIFVSFIVVWGLGIFPILLNYLYNDDLLPNSKNIKNGVLGFFLFKEKSELDKALKNSSRFKL